MGIPSFYKWLNNNFPKCIANVITQQHSSEDVNGFEFDNLYLDMNGIIHPCFSDSEYDESKPKSVEQGFESVFEYVDRLFQIVRPRKLVYFAIDGVSPRAKLNVQRAGWFQSTRNIEIAEAEEDRLRQQYERQGKKVLPKPESRRVEDSIFVVPGTEFMCEFSDALQEFISNRLQDSPAWKNLKVIVSDANVPGEGEHKIMSFIRSQRSLPDYDANTRHCLHGLDADLIILALATHELHFSILRENVLNSNKAQPYGAVGAEVSGSCKPKPVRKDWSYQFVHIWILREYLEFEMRPSDTPRGFEFDIDRAVDDFVFLTFFVGNDFLPQLPSLGVHEGALDLLMTVYKRDFKSIGGYLVDTQRVYEAKLDAYLELERVEKLLLSVGSYEDKIFQKMIEMRECKMRHILDEQSCLDVVLLASPHPDTDENDNILENTMHLIEDLRKCIHDKSDILKPGLGIADKIKYGTPGWKERYYNQRFATKNNDTVRSLKKTAAKEYIEGLCWVLLYYYSDVPSWSWFYPFHYAPCASDLNGLGKLQLQVNFEEGVPFEPFDQLMAVISPSHAEALPLAYRKLMKDESSQIAHFFPSDFEIDLDGKMFLWQGRCILPFIDEKLLLDTTMKLKAELTEREAERNLLKYNDLLIVRASSDFGHQLLSKIKEKPRDINGVDGFVNLGKVRVSTNEKDRIICVTFSLAKPTIFVPRILEHANFPRKKTVHKWNIKEKRLWHEQQGGCRCHRVNQIVSSSPPPTPESREGLYNHPNRFKSIGNEGDQNHRQRPVSTSLGFRPFSNFGSGRGRINGALKDGGNTRW